MDIIKTQEILKAAGLLLEGSYKSGELDTSTNKAIDKLLSVTGTKDVDSAIEKYASVQTSEAPTKDTSDVKVTVTTEDPPKSPSSSAPSPNAPKRANTRASYKFDMILCHIVNLRTNSIIDFSLESPATISEDVSANFTSIQTKGRSHPWLSYDSSNGRSIQITLELYDDYCKDGLMETINKLKALTYPVVEGDRIKSPECRIFLGNTARMNNAVISSVSVTWQKPYRDGLYLGASVNLSVLEVVDKSLDQKAIEAGGF